MNSKRYKLLKDLPYSNKGDLYIWDEGKRAYYTCDGNILGVYWSKEFVENNQTLFEEVKDDTAVFVWTDELVGEYGDWYREIQGSSWEYLGWDRIDAFKDYKGIKSSQKLFTTEDGKDIYEGDEWWVNINDVPTKNIGRNMWYDEPIIKFSTESATQEYIDKIKNKNVVLDVGDGDKISYSQKTIKGLKNIFSKEEKLYTQSEL